MTQGCLKAAARTLTAPIARRLGAPLTAGGQRRECTLADLVEDPAILPAMGCWGSDRRSLELLLETLAPRAASGMPPAVASDPGPDFFQ